MKQMMRIAEELWPINRSLTGSGTRETLELIKRELPRLEILNVRTGEQVFDWTVPKEWSITEAYLIGPDGSKICDFAVNNLHVVGYSTPVDLFLSLDELQKHLHSLPEQPTAIPYVTSYYQEIWGFCITHEVRLELQPGTYHAVIRSSLFDGVLNYGELHIPGASDREIFFSTYVCHPSMANNELSGPVLAVALADALMGRNLHYSYRFVFLPETIGSIVYLSRNLERLKRDLLAGFVLTCVGDERAYSYLPSRIGNTPADEAALRAAENLGLKLVRYSWLDRGSDERQYCSPGADLPFCSLMRSKYGEYPEYHTSLDTLHNVVTQTGLEGSLALYLEVVRVLESERYPMASSVCEPQLGRRGMYPTTSKKGVYASTRAMMNLLSLSDGKTPISRLSTALAITEEQVMEICELLGTHSLIKL